jgi:hypothetical protein
MATQTLPTPTGGALVKAIPGAVTINTGNATTSQANVMQTNANLMAQYGAGNYSITPQGAVVPKTSTTTASNVPKQAQALAIQNKNTTLTNPANYGISTNANGGMQYANGTAYTPPTETKTDTNKTNQPNTYVDYQGNTVPIPSDSSVPLGVTLTPGSNGNYLGSDGLQYKAPTGDTSYDDQQIMSNLAQIKANSDSAMASAVDGISKAYDNYIAQQKETNRGQQAGVNNALIMGGVTGQGSSSQYAPISSQGIITAQINYGQQQIMKLQNERDNLIAQAKNADYSTAGGNKALMNINDQLEKNKQQQIDAAVKLNNIIADQNAKMAETKMQQSKDNAVADQIANGVTNHATILKNLTESGMAITAKEINDAISAVTKSGGMDLSNLSGEVKNFEALKAMGELPAGVTSLPQYLAMIKGKTSGTGGSANDLAFQVAVNKYLPKILEEGIDGPSWGIIFNALHSQFPDKSFVEIDNALGKGTPANTSNNANLQIEYNGQVIEFNTQEEYDAAVKAINEETKNAPVAKSNTNVSKGYTSAGNGMWYSPEGEMISFEEMKKRTGTAINLSIPKNSTYDLYKSLFGNTPMNVDMNPKTKKSNLYSIR